VVQEMSTAIILELKEVSKYFGGLRALDQVSFGIREGDIVGLIGPNGSGKTTLLNGITGFLPLTTGELIYKRERLYGLSAHSIVEKGIARTFQITSIFPNLPVAENIIASMHLKTNGTIWGSFFRTKAYEREEMKMRRKTAGLLGASLGLQEKGNVIAKNLALGEQRNLEITIALATEPTLLLLDEPAAGLNSIEVGQLARLLCSLHERGITLLIVEHNMKLVMQVCNHIVVLNSGRKIAEGTPDEISGNQEVISVYLGGKQESARD
jgi:branched-chain amino acid transport system ATP-binding protein